jgi:Ca2+/Na+ antiporter
MHFLAGYAAFLDYQYWINPRPVPLGPSLVGSIFAFFGWFVLASVILYVVARHFKKHDRLKREVLRRFARVLLLTAVLGYLFLFFSYEQLPLLGMRLWFLVLFLLFTVWLVRAIVYTLKDYPQLRKQEAERRRYEKYLPKAG